MGFMRNYVELELKNLLLPSPFHVRLLDDIMLKLHTLSADFWKQDQFSDNIIVQDNYKSKRKDYRLFLCNFFKPS